jgi:hypothetical protein
MLAVVFSVLLGVQAQAPSQAPSQAQAPNDFETARSFRCVFPDEGMAREVSNAGVSGPSNQPMGKPEVVFSNLARSGRTAEKTDGYGSGPVTLQAGDNAMSFVEIMPTGSYVVTTIFRSSRHMVNQSSVVYVPVFRAVQTRHVAMDSRGWVVTFYGTCRPQMK